jgi:small subunit ribosomal protein S9
MNEPQDHAATTGASESSAEGTASVQKHGLTAPPLPPGTKYIWGTGRRKQAVARVRIRPGSGQFTINKRPANEYFTEEKDRISIVSPLQAANMLSSWDVWAQADGGGFTGQAGAVTMGLARALFKAVPESESALRSRGLLTRDSRMKERKKYGQKGARKRFQFSKR